jgi:hypothetical protein
MVSGKLACGSMVASFSIKRENGGKVVEEKKWKT